MTEEKRLTDLSQKLIFSLIAEAFLSGAALGLIYESVRLIRLLILSSGSALYRGASAVFTFITDLVFCLTAASTAILLTYNISGGVFRGSLYLAMGAGSLCYRVTVGRILYKIEAAAARFIKKVMISAMRVIFFPFKMLFSLFVRIYRLTIGRIIGKIVCKVRAKKETRRRRAENTCAEQLLPERTNEEEDNADEHKGYRKEGRISFGGH